MIDKRKAWHLIGETAREVGILILVFAPLDAFFQKEPSVLPVLSAMVAMALLLIVAGIMMEAGE